MQKSFSKPEARYLGVALIIALLLAAWLLHDFFIIIVLSAVAAYIFYPVFAWLNRRLKRAGAASALTLLLTLLIVVVPLIAVAVTTFHELQAAAQNFGSYTKNVDLTELSTRAVEKVSDTVSGLTRGTITLDIDQARDFITSNASKALSGLLGIATNSLGGIGAFFVAFILYLYLFTAFLLNHKSLTSVFRAINPLGARASDLYLQQAGAMTKAMVRGQFVIALLQGIIGALSLYVAGIDLFWIMTLVLTVLSIIPLGGGAVTIPIAIVLLLTGHIWQGLVVLLTHFIVVTNIDNVLRPLLVPKEVRLNSALTMLSVFAGIGLFGILGIVIGPVLMILIVSTVRLYIAAQTAKPTEPTA